MRVLLSAFGFSPYRGSEAAVGWHVARNLAQWHEVIVLTGAVRCAPNDYERYARENGPVRGLTVEYVKPDRLTCLWDKLHRIPGLWFLYYVAYRRWQRLAYERALVLNSQKSFDIVHHLTMIGFREPGYLWKMPIPFFWGPVGGAVNEPLRYLRVYSFAGKVNAILRTLINGTQKALLWRPRAAAAAAFKIWAVTQADAQMIANWNARSSLLIEAGTDSGLFRKVRKWDGKNTLRIVWSGTHTYGKALPILIRALMILRRKKEVNLVVSVLGDGPEHAKWVTMAKRCGVAELIDWRGRLEHSLALEVMQESHVLVCTSVKEATSIVVVEAISMGLPVICHDACGMGIAVTSRCGIKIPLKGPKVSVRGFASALMAIIENPDLVSRFSEGALARSKELTWAEKAKVIAKAYEFAWKKSQFKLDNRNNKQ